MLTDGSTLFGGVGNLLRSSSSQPTALAELLDVRPESQMEQDIALQGHSGLLLSASNIKAVEDYLPQLKDLEAQLRRERASLVEWLSLHRERRSTPRAEREDLQRSHSGLTAATLREQLTQQMEECEVLKRQKLQEFPTRAQDGWLTRYSTIAFQSARPSWKRNGTAKPKQAKQLSYTRHRYGPQQTVPQRRKPSGLKELPNEEVFLQTLQKVAPNARVYTLTTPRPEADRPQLVAPVNMPSDDRLAVTVATPLSMFTARLLAQRGLQSENVDELAVVVMQKLSITEQDAKAIEQATCGQRSAPLWFSHRKGRVTASIFKDVCRSKKARCTTLVNRIFNAKTINAPAVQYGIANEAVAKERLLGYLEGLHSNARIEDCGLMINPKYPLLGCSPDGIFRCECHEPSLVEVKCLYSLRDCNPSELLA
ncbi:hypothetical protein HPB48_021425 [Haemaphysalis longicornis]|uniref:YqaJ viral recombinase domain-containing protein n=1 Tax=Haemaphysalis longicornis TaxID=44386 RepID=A0A9J6FCT3_HAELO|nr:hypothetical protein HPB48_021425 [Haemaphysalis longicornis]